MEMLQNEDFKVIPKITLEVFYHFFFLNIFKN